MLRDPDLDPLGGRHRKPPIKRTYDHRVVRQDRWARWIGWALALAFGPLVLTAVGMRAVGVIAMPGPLKVAVALCFVIGMSLAVLIVVLWAVVDRP